MYQHGWVWRELCLMNYKRKKRNAANVTYIWNQTTTKNRSRLIDIQCHILHWPGPGDCSQREGIRGPKSPVKQGHFICRKACLYIFNKMTQFSSVAQSCLTLWPHESQHARPPCSSPNLRVHTNSCALSWWCHQAISSSVVPFSSSHLILCRPLVLLPLIPPSIRVFMNWLFSWGGQSIRVSASAWVLPVNTQDWSPFRMDWLDLLAIQGTHKSLLWHHSSKASILWCSAFFTVSH